MGSDDDLRSNSVVKANRLPSGLQAADQTISGRLVSAIKSPVAYSHSRMVPSPLTLRKFLAARGEVRYFGPRCKAHPPSVAQMHLA